jgi:hypothetical protein
VANATRFAVVTDGWGKNRRGGGGSGRLHLAGCSLMAEEPEED